MWFVNPKALARARLDQLLSQEDLAKKAGVSLRSVQRFESTEQVVRLYSLQLLAKALSVEVHDIASLRTADKPAKGRPAVPVGAPTPQTLPPRSQLETLVDLERDAGVTSAKLDTPHGPAETLTARRLQDIFTAYALYEGRLFALTGKVDGQRALATSEAQLLGSRGGIAARFHVVKEVVPGQPVGVTVHTAQKEHTVFLQDNLGNDVTAILRVVLVPGEPRDDGPGFSAFITRLTVKRPWTFVVAGVGGVQGGGRDGGADAKGKGSGKANGNVGGKKAKGQGGK